MSMSMGVGGRIPMFLPCSSSCGGNANPNVDDGRHAGRQAGTTGVVRTTRASLVIMIILSIGRIISGKKSSLWPPKSFGPPTGFRPTPGFPSNPWGRPWEKSLP